jgi:hypothetical protein
VKTPRRVRRVMTIKQARGIISFIWIAATAPLVILVGIQTALGKYGHEWDSVWSWLSPLIFPTLALVIAVWSLSDNPVEKKAVRSLASFWGTVVLSVSYLFLIWGLILVEPFSEFGWANIMRSSGLYLGFIQGVVAAAIAKFFVEHIH